MAIETNLLNKILTMAEKTSIVVCLEGDAAAGKTTKAESISKTLRKKGLLVSVIHMDDFFLPFNMKTPERLAEAGENIHYERFLQEVAPFLRKKINFEPATPLSGNTCYGKFDCSVGKITTSITLSKSDVYIVEGSYSMNKNLIDLYDITVFIKIDTQTQMDRIYVRNTPAIAERYKNEWIPMEKQFHKAFNLEKKADFVLLGK